MVWNNHIFQSLNKQTDNTILHFILNVNLNFLGRGLFRQYYHLNNRRPYKFYLVRHERIELSHKNWQFFRLPLHQYRIKIKLTFKSLHPYRNMQSTSRPHHQINWLDFIWSTVRDSNPCATLVFHIGSVVPDLQANSA